MMNSLNIKLFALLLTLGLVSMKADKKIVADKKLSSLSYAASHPMHDWTAKSTDVGAVVVLDEATQQLKQVAVSIPVASFDSENGNRDSHMIEMLEGLKFPKVTFSSSDIKTEGDVVTARGNLTFHGVTKPYEIKAKKTMSGGKMTLEGNFTVKITDHKIEQPSLMGIKMKDELTMNLKVVFSI